MPVTTKDSAAVVVLYNALRSEGDRTTYIGSGHSDIVKDQMVVSSIAPKRTATSFGNRRSTVNLLRGVSVATPAGAAESKDLKVELNVSIPVGVSDNAVSEALARVLSLDLATLKAIVVTGKTQL